MPEAIELAFHECLDGPVPWPKKGCPEGCNEVDAALSSARTGGHEPLDG